MALSTLEKALIGLLVISIGVNIYAFVSKHKQKRKMIRKNQLNVTKMFERMANNPDIIEEAKNETKIARRQGIDTKNPTQEAMPATYAVNKVIKDAVDLDVGSKDTCAEDVAELCEEAWNKVTFDVKGEQINEISPYKSEALCTRDKLATECGMY
jgi:DNA polymerase I-like protein with 3'-5' exonuclease and polymerase domains